MYLAASAYSFEVLPLDACLCIVKNLGFEHTDLSGFHARGRCSFEPEDIAADPKAQARIAKSLLEKYELQCGDFFPQFGASPAEHSLNDPDPAIRARDLELIEACAQFCAELGIPGMTILPGVDHPQRKHEDNLHVAGEALANAAAIGERYDVEMRFEPHMASVAPTPELAIRLVEEFAPAAKVTLDCSHYTLQYIPQERIDALIPYTGHVHIRPSRMGKLATRYAENTIPWDHVIEGLRAAGYDRALSMEYVAADWYDINQMDTLYETAVTRAALLPLVEDV